MAEDKDSEYRIIDDDPPKIRFNGGGIKVVVKSVTSAASNTDPERSVAEFFKGSDGKCLICELRCGKDDCTECDVPHYSEKITTRVMETITTHKSQPMVKMERVSKPQRFPL